MRTLQKRFEKSLCVKIIVAFTQQQLSEPPCFSLRLEQDQDVSLSDWPLDVADDGSAVLVHEFHLDLGTLTLGAGTAEDLEDACLSNLLVHGFW